MKGLCRIALAVLFVAACGGDSGITGPDPSTSPPVSGGILALGVDSTTGASIETNQDDYAPGEVVHVVGRGWAAGETVNLHMTEAPNTHADVDTNVVADANGGFSMHFYDVQVHDIGVTFTLVVTGETSGSRAVATFTDRNYRLFHSVGVADFTGESAFWTNTNCSNSASGNYGVGTAGSGTVVTNGGSTYARDAVNNQSLRFRVPKTVGTYTFNGWDYGQATTSGNDSSDATFKYSKCIAGENGSGAREITALYIPPNEAPELNNINTQTVNEGATVAFNANASDDDLPAPPADLTFSLGTPACANPVPTGVGGASIDPGSGQFTWATNEATNATSTTFCARVVVSDGALSDFQDVTINVNELNSAPVLTVPASFSANAGAAIPSAAATVADPDVPANSHTFTKVSGPAWVTVALNGVITYGATTAADAGANVVVIKVEDNGSPVMSDQESYTVNIIAANQPPVLNAISNPVVNEGTTVTVDADATDDALPAPHALTYSLGTPSCTHPVPTGFGGASINSLTGQFSWPTNEATNAVTTTFCAMIVVSDGSLTDEQEITITVNELNAAPVLTAINNKSGNELSTISFLATATDSDQPPNTLSFSLIDAPSGAGITEGGAFSWIPTEAQGPGDYTFTVRVTDDGSPNLFDEEEITVHVNEVNAAPVLAAIGNKMVNEETLLTFDANATDADVPANALTYSLDAAAPAGASINAATGVFSWTPTEAQGPNTYSITVRVTDNGDPELSDHETITITVNEVNIAPVLAAIDDKEVDEGSALTFTATATDADVPVNTLSYSLGAGAPPGASINASSGVFTWTPTDGPTQSTTITIVVTDDGSPSPLSDSETFLVTVNNVDPVIGALPNAAWAPVPAGPGNVTLNWSFEDPGADSWTCQVEWDTSLGFTTVVNEGAKGCKAVGSLTAGIYTVRIRVMDDDSGEDIESIAAYIVVYDPNGGFVTGGGWIDSPVGASTQYPTATGKANFGFTSKYLPGRNVPTGNTEFQFQAGNLNFKSTVYEWLVVAGDRAQYKGDGTVNGVAGFGFLLTAIDGSQDKFRIKIVKKSDGSVVYDNQSGYGDDSPAATALGGGSIVIHTKK